MIDNDLISLVTTGSMKQGNNWGTGVILVHPQTHKLLLGERTDNHLMASPGGKVEFGESPLQGIIRETKEESNIILNTVKLYDYRVHSSQNGKNWVSFLFISDNFDDSNIKNQESEFGPLDWYSLEEVLKMDLFEPTKTSIERAITLGLLDDCQDSNHYIPFVECDKIYCGAHDSCTCAYSYQPADGVFTVTVPHYGDFSEMSDSGMPVWD